MQVVPNGVSFSHGGTTMIAAATEQVSPSLRELLMVTPVRPALELLRVGDLIVDHRYQREHVAAAHVAAIVDRFDWSLFFAIGVNRRGNGGLYVFDGQHRVSAVLELFGPDEQVPALVTQGLGASDEARLFHAMQSTRKALTAADRFKAQVFRGDPAALEIVAIASQHGFEIRQGVGGTGLPGVSAIERLYYPTAGIKADGTRTPRMAFMEGDPAKFGPQWRGREKLSWVLSVAAGAWNYSEQVTSAVLIALGTIWSAGREMPSGVDLERLAGVLRFRSPKGWDVRVREKRTPLWVLIAEDYNRGLRGRNRILTAQVRADDEAE